MNKNLTCFSITPSWQETILCCRGYPGLPRFRPQPFGRPLTCTLRVHVIVGNQFFGLNLFGTRSRTTVPILFISRRCRCASGRLQVLVRRTRVPRSCENRRALRRRGLTSLGVWSHHGAAFSDCVLQMCVCAFRSNGAMRAASGQLPSF